MSEEEIVPIMKAIIQVSLEDNVDFFYNGIQAIKDGEDYPGFRVTFTASIERTRQRLKVDIATGDTIIPKEIVYAYPLMFEERHIQIMAHNVETVLAEKYETVITRSVFNTRMRDYYDIYLLHRLVPINNDYFKQSFEKTTNNRGTQQQANEREAILMTVLSSSDMQGKLVRYQKKYEYANTVSWEIISEAVRELDRQLNEPL